LDNDGIAIWSATPETGGPELYELRQRADDGDPDVEAFTLLVADNPYIPEEHKQKFFRDLPGELREIKYHGKYLRAGRRCYPRFDPDGIHGYDPHELPDDLTRFLAVDPGPQRCGTVVVGVDRDERYVWVLDAFALRNVDAQQWADAVLERHGKHKFEAMVIDQQRGKQHHGIARSVAELHSDALAQRGIIPHVRGHAPHMGMFFPGTKDVPAREEPRLRLPRGELPELESEIRKAEYDAKGKRRRAPNMPEDLLVCLEYLTGLDPYYRERPPSPEPKRSAVAEAAEEYLESRRRRQRHAGITLG